MVAIDKDRLIAQLKKDEGFIPHAKWDIKQWTYGYGCLAPSGSATITEPEAAKYLAKRVEQSIQEFGEMFPGALAVKFNPVRAEAFINILFNMGKGSQTHPEKGGLYSFVNTLSQIYDHYNVDWKAVADGFRASKWAKQVDQRAVRLTKEIETGVK